MTELCLMMCQGVRWRDPDLHEVIAFLNNPNAVVKANAAAYLQHLCYNSDPVKQQTRLLGGIPPLVALVSSEHPDVHRNACGALRSSLPPSLHSFDMFLDVLTFEFLLNVGIFPTGGKMTRTRGRCTKPEAFRLWLGYSLEAPSRISRNWSPEFCGIYRHVK